MVTPARSEPMAASTAHPPRPSRLALRILGRAMANFVEDRGTHLSAAISYYALFALFPLTLLAASVFGIVLRAATVRERVIDQLFTQLPLNPNNADTVREALSNAAALGPTLSIVSLFGALWTAGALSDALVRDLTAHRTLGLRVALGEQPDVALIAVTHALAAQTFYRAYDEGTCLEIRPTTTPLGGHADGIEDTAAAKALADRHEAWAVQMPHDAADLWAFVVALDDHGRISLFAHCAALTVFAIRQRWDGKRGAQAAADTLAEAVSLDMTAHWTPTVQTYFGRVTRARIVQAVRDGVSEAAAERIASMKKQPMAEAAEQLLAGTGWLPVLLRTPKVGEADAGLSGAPAA